MPRLPQFKIAAIGELFRQLEYAPLETRLRQMDAAERLIADIDPAVNYPQEFVIYRITGYRSDRAEEPVTFVGEALRPDLLNLVLQLSRSAELGENYNKRNAVPISAIAQRLQVSPKTVQRYRQQGLVCHYVRTANGRERLACFEDALERFTTSHHERLVRAASFSRMDEQAEASLIAQARELRSARR